MKKTLLILLSVFIVSSCKEEVNSKFTISVPDKSGQVRFYYHTNDFVIKNGCIEFAPIENSLNVYKFCNSYDIYRR